jgi:hypothetical protein
MLDLLSKMRSEDLATTLIAIVAVSAVVVGVLIRLIVYSVRRYRERQLATTLILEMLDRGMTADDIVRVLSAAGLEDRGEEVMSLRERLRQRLGRSTSTPAKATPES